MSALKSFLNAQKTALSVMAWLFIFFTFVTLFRPLLPVDETRYLSVAWEMFSHKSYFLLTNNGEPYHHKPPLLFWLINLSWQIFGVSRTAAMVPIFLVSAGWLLTMRALFLTLWPAQHERANTVLWLLLGSFPFLIYGTLIMFDMSLALCVGLVLIALYHFAKTGLWRYTIFGGIAMGLGILAKGPPELIFLIGPVFGYIWWTKGQKTNFISGKRFSAGIGLLFLSSLIPVAAWLVPLIMQADLDFLMSLIWKQSAGRISGHMSGSHARPVYFYLMIAPVLFLPWLVFSSVRKGIIGIGRSGTADQATRFLLSVIVPAFLIFSLISGKQPHYMVPLAGPLLLLIFLYAQKLRHQTVRITTMILVSFLCLAHMVGAYSFLKPFDMSGLIEGLHKTPHEGLVWVRNYQNEIGFLARLDDEVVNAKNVGEAKEWLKSHPQALMIARVRYEPNNTDLSDFDCFYVQKYRSKEIALCVLEGDPRGAAKLEEIVK